MKFATQILALFLSLVTASCSAQQPRVPHAETNSVYYWKTVFDLDSAEVAFLRDHHVERVYVRMFDVVDDDGEAEPNASIKFDEANYRLVNQTLSDIEFVPVVYITLDALKAMKGRETELAQKIVTRVRNMCSYNGLPNVRELQLDCDWTSLTEISFFSLCNAVKQQSDDLTLGSTIRLHQLKRPAPPVDYGVLMVYNTGSYNNPDAQNSIISSADVKPYLDGLGDYALHLDVAYPTYSWQLLFRSRHFMGLTNGVDVNDPSLFRAEGSNVYCALADFEHHGVMIYEGDIIRLEDSSIDDVVAVKQMIEQKLAGRPHSNIIYHLDSKNLSKYTSDEIEKIYKTGR